MARAATALKKLIIILLASMCLQSCQKDYPADFWTGFKPDLIEHFYGHGDDSEGNFVVYWSSNNEDSFGEKVVIEFARKYHWEPVDTTHFTREEMTDWFMEVAPVFPIYFKGEHKMYSDSDLDSFTAFERYILQDLTVYRFKTESKLAYIGSNDFTQENGYVLISADRKQMCLYSLW